MDNINIVFIGTEEEGKELQKVVKDCEHMVAFRTLLHRLGLKVDERDLFLEVAKRTFFK